MIEYNTKYLIGIDTGLSQDYKKKLNLETMNQNSTFKKVWS